MLAALAVVALLIQAHLQSREDDQREQREGTRDNLLTELQKNMPKQTAEPVSTSNALLRGVPTTPGNFDSVEFFRTAYHGPLQDALATSFKAEAERVRPQDTATFYLDVLSVGGVMVMFDGLWWPLYRSQLRALLKLNGDGGLTSIDSFKSFYSDASAEFSKEYQKEKITFEGWLRYLEANTLLTVHPSKMVEITVKGREFLKYLLHRGLSESAKRL